MRLFLSVFVCKLVTKLCRLLGKKGGVFPGLIVHDYIDKHVLTKIKYPKYVIAVTGSSGKGSTTELIAHILRDNGLDVCYNEDDSNGILAAMTLILNNSTLSGKFKHDVLLLECDERHLKLIFEKKQMTHLVITNITRDQPGRNGTYEVVFKDIVEAIGNDTQLVINADDVKVNTLRDQFKNVVTYGVAKMPDSYKKPRLNCVDFQYCPKCHRKLNYNYYHYGHIGNYECPNHDFSRNPVDYEARKVNLKEHTMQINGHDVYLNKDVIYAVYYTLAAYALVRCLGFKEEDILKSINEHKMITRRGKTYKLGKRNVIMLESKNENNLSYYQSLKYIKDSQEAKSVVLGFDNVSRRYKSIDLSWLYDVDFELLDEPSIDKIICIGRFRYDVATRLSYAGIDRNKIILVDDLDKIIDIIKTKSKGTIYTMVCFDMTELLTKKIEEENDNENN